MSPSTKLPPRPSKLTLTTTTATATATATTLMTDKEKSSLGLRELCNKGVAWRKQTENAVVLQAAKDLLQTRAETGGNATYGDVKHILQTYQDLGHVFVTRGRLSYQVEKLTSGKKKKNTTISGTTFPSFIHVSSNDESSVQSELTDSFGSTFKFSQSISFAAEAERSNNMDLQQTFPTAAGVHMQQLRNRAAGGRPIATISTEQSNSHQQTNNSSMEQRSDDINRVIRDVAFFLTNER